MTDWLDWRSWIYTTVCSIIYSTMALVAADQVTKKVDKTTANTNQVQDLGGSTSYGSAKDFAPGQQTKNRDQSANTFAPGQEKT